MCTCILINFHVHIIVGGDQMTAARVRGCQRLMSNSGDDIERLEGMTAIVEDWHAKVVFLVVSTHK